MIITFSYVLSILYVQKSNDSYGKENTAWDRLNWHIPDCNPHQIPKPRINFCNETKKDQNFQSENLHESIIWSKNAYKIFLDPKNPYAAIISVLSFFKHNQSCLFLISNIKIFFQHSLWPKKVSQIRIPIQEIKNNNSQTAKYQPPCHP